MHDPRAGTPYGQPPHPAVRSRRKGGQTGLMLRRVAAGLVAVGLFVAAMWIDSHKEDLRWGASDPIATQGQTGKVISTEDFELKTGQVAIARSVVRYSKTIQTSGVFVIIPVQVKSLKKPVQLEKVRLETADGLSYSVSGVTSPELNQPLLWTSDVLAFDLPPKKLAGAKLVASANTTGFRATRPALEAVVDLGINAGEADKLIRSAKDRYEVRKI